MSSPFFVSHMFCIKISQLTTGVFERKICQIFVGLGKKLLLANLWIKLKFYLFALYYIPKFINRALKQIKKYQGPLFAGI